MKSKQQHYQFGEKTREIEAILKVSGKTREIDEFRKALTPLPEDEWAGLLATYCTLCNAVN